MDLPATDLSLLVTLPKLIGPDLKRLRESIEHDDPDWGWDALTSTSRSTPPNKEHDSPTRSSNSATSTGSTATKPPTPCLTSTPAQPASSPPACSEAVAVSIGANRTPGGLHIAA